MDVCLAACRQDGMAILYASAAMKDGKNGIDPQTATDLANERLVMDRLKAAFPQHGLIGEETVAATGKMPEIPKGPTWIVDPIDGTQNFCCSLPVAAVSIGLCVGGQPALGVIYDPYRDELFVGLASEGKAFVNGERLRSCQETGAPASLEAKAYDACAALHRKAWGAGGKAEM